MISHLNKFIIQEDNSELDQTYYTYAQLIKNERIQRRWTLAETSQGICSVSYLSKIENQIIKPDIDCVKAIFARYHLDFELVTSSTNNNSIDKLIHYYLHNEFAAIEEMYHRINDDFYHVSDSITRAFFHLIHQQEEPLLQEMKRLDRIKKTMRRKEKIAFVILANEVLMLKHEIKSMYPHLLLLRKSNIRETEYQWIISFQEFYYGYHTRDTLIMYKKYQEMFQFYHMGFPTQKLAIMQLMLLDVKAIEYFDEAYAEISTIHIDQLSERYTHDIYYYKYMVLLRGAKYYDIMDEVINKNLYCDSKMIALLAYCAFRTRDRNHISQLRSLINNHHYDSFDNVHKTFIHFMITKINDEKESNTEIIEYLKTDIMYYNKSHPHALYSRVYDFLFVQEMGRMSRYKEIYIFAKKNYSL